MSTNVATIPQPSIMGTMAERYGMRPDAFEATLRATVIPSGASREEVAAFLLVANNYKLNPITREIYAYPRKGGGIQPIVGVDGWSHIINDHPAFDGMEFVDTIEKGVVTAVTCRMWRKDRSHPVEATEYLVECLQPSATWSKWPRRMLRHKAMIQAARYCFGFSGIVDPDEAARFVDRSEKHTEHSSSLDKRLTRLAQPRQPVEPTPPRPPIPPQPEDDDPPDEPNEDEGGEFDDENDMARKPDDGMGYDTTRERDIDREKLFESGQARAIKGTRALKRWFNTLHPDRAQGLDAGGCCTARGRRRDRRRAAAARGCNLRSTSHDLITRTGRCLHWRAESDDR